MRRNAFAALAALALAGVAASGATDAQYMKKTVNCAQRPYRNTIRATLSANLVISVYPHVCVVTEGSRGT